ncbi:MAG TPA: hypothetical protein VEZ55_13715 [Chitinophagaceae bacterium]|jgi:hypothetical protein|nr:hypothetical protein [Chitinophagaceae bacterium]
MRRAVVEKGIVVVLFVTVMVLFTLADKESKKIKSLYTYVTHSLNKLTASAATSLVE